VQAVAARGHDAARARSAAAAAAAASSRARGDAGDEGDEGGGDDDGRGGPRRGSMVAAGVGVHLAKKVSRRDDAAQKDPVSDQLLRFNRVR